MQIVHHPNWYRDFLEDMARRGPTHLRDASQHCPIDNTINSFTHFYGDKNFIKPRDQIDESKGFFYLISIDCCDDDSIAELIYYGRELVNQKLVRPYIIQEAIDDLNNFHNCGLIIENAAEGHASDKLFDALHVLVSQVGIPFEKTYYTNSTQNLRDMYDRYLLNKPYATIDKIKMFNCGGWNELVCQQMLDDNYQIEKNEDMCEFRPEPLIDTNEYWSLSVECTKQLEHIREDINKPHLFLYKHMNAKRGFRTLFLALLHKEHLLDNNLYSTPEEWRGTQSSAVKYINSITWDRNWAEGFEELYPVLLNVKGKIPTYIDREHNHLDFDPNTNFSSDNHMYYNARRNCDIEIVGESEFEGSIFLTEKFLKAIIFKQPFMILGSPNSWTKIKEMGYMSYEPYIKESYDKNEDELQRMNEIIQEIKRLRDLKRDKEAWRNWLEGINRIAVQNYNIYLQNLIRRVRMTTLDDYVAGTGELVIPSQELGD